MHCSASPARCPHVPYQGVRWDHLHRLGLIGAQEIDGRLVRHLTGKPAIIVPAVQDDGHPGMDRRHQFVGLCGDDAEGLKPMPCRVFPSVPEASKCENEN
jgi:hypothetical protein